MAPHIPPDQEQALVRAFFEDATTGFFVDVGANHPTEGSQTWHLEQAGWTGVLVEPQPDLAAFLVTARKAKVFAVACSSPDRTGTAMGLHVAGPLSSLEPRRMAPGARTEYIVMVPVRTLDQILEEAEAPTPIDFLSIDVEGHQVAVLEGFDFAHWRPRLIVIEDHVENLDTHRLMRRHGYRLLRRLGFNGWYVPVNSALRSTAAERREIVRKYYLALPFRMMRNALRRLRGK